MQKHQPRLLFDTVQLLEIGLLGSTVLVWLEGEKRTGAALEEGTEETEGDIKTTMTYFPISFTHQKSTARCVYCLKPFWCCLPGQRQSLCGGSRWLPCSCHCLSTRKRLPPFSSAHTKFRLRRVFLRQARVSARATVYPAKHRLPPAKIQPPRYSRDNYLPGWILVTVNRPWIHVCVNPPPPKRKSANLQRRNICGVFHARHCRGEVEMAACNRRGHFAAEWLLVCS